MADLGTDRRAIARADARGLVAAMAMTGMREFTANIGLLEKSPPEAILEKHAPPKVKRLPEESRSAITELVHWAYGAACGAVYGMLPLRIRRDGRSGPIYGMAVWLAFELGVNPLLGIRLPRRRRVAHRAMLALDHTLYGIVVSGRLAPAPEARPS